MLVQCHVPLFSRHHITSAGRIEGSVFKDRKLSKSGRCCPNASFRLTNRDERASEEPSGLCGKVMLHLRDKQKQTQRQRQKVFFVCLLNVCLFFSSVNRSDLDSSIIEALSEVTFSADIIVAHRIQHPFWSPLDFDFEVRVISI